MFSEMIARVFRRLIINKYAWVLAILLVLACTIPMLARRGSSDGQTQPGAAWSEFGKDMEKMHAGMRSIKSSGNSDVDFVRLMLPHHQAAIDMAKTELLYGKDPQLRRLAQEIITDQQSETEVMQLWLTQHVPGSPK
jgi:uncharacterized protein (DUF305 family)